MFFCDLAYPVEARGITEDGDGQDCFCFFGDFFFNQVVVDIESSRVDIDKDGGSGSHYYAICRGDECKWSSDDFVAGADVEGLSAEEEGACA